MSAHDEPEQRREVELDDVDAEAVEDLEVDESGEVRGGTSLNCRPL